MSYNSSFNPGNLMQIVSEKYKNIIDRSKNSLNELLLHVREHTADDLESKLRSAIDNIENLFLIVFMGEFSTGKSSVINALVGEKVLPEGITPTTDRITIIKYGEKKESKLEEGVLNVTVPDPKLENIYLVDTPGTNVTIEQHEKITQDFIPRADIIFFTIGAERAVTGSESNFIKFLREDWKKNIVFLLNKIDIAGSEEELEGLLNHTEKELRRIFGIDPYIIPVSAKRALEDPGNPESGFDRLSDYVFNTLSEEERIRIKLKSSLDLSLTLVDQTERSIEKNLGKIDSDLQKLKEFESRLESMKEDILSNSTRFTERIRNRMLEFKTRGLEYIDELIRFENIFKLVRKDKVAREFERRVSLQTVNEIEKDLEDMVKWTEQSAKTIVDNSISFYRESIEQDQPEFRSNFSQNRLRLVDTVRSELETRKKQIDPQTLGSNLVDSARTAIASVLGVQVGSLAIGASVVSAFSSFIVDITGILTTIAVMATAFAILPKKRSNAIKDFSAKVDALTEELVSNLESQIGRDMDNLTLQISDSMGPLRNFYNTQKKKHEQSREEIKKIKDELTKIKSEISD